jgi:hypothetical protein
MKDKGGVVVLLQVLLTSTLNRGDWSATRRSRFTPRESATGTHLMRGSDGSQSGFDLRIVQPIAHGASEI